MHRKILIVEDNELNMKLFTDLLEAHGFLTVQSDGGLNAVEMVREHKPDLVLMDIQLPEISGLDVTKAIRKDKSVEKWKLIELIPRTCEFGVKQIYKPMN